MGIGSALGIGLGGGLLNLIFGSDDKMIDTQRPLSAKEKSALLAKMFKSLDENFAGAEGNLVSGLERRGLASPGQVAGGKTRLKGQKSVARGNILSDVNLATRGQTFIPGQGLPGLEGIGKNLSTLLNPPTPPQNNIQSLLDMLNQQG